MQVTGRKSSWWRELGTSRFSSTSFAGWCRSCAGRAGMDELALAPQQLRSPRWCGRGDRQGRGCGDTGAGPFHRSQARAQGIFSTQGTRGVQLSCLLSVGARAARLTPARWVNPKASGEAAQPSQVPPPVTSTRSQLNTRTPGSSRGLLATRRQGRSVAAAHAGRLVSHSKVLWPNLSSHLHCQAGGTCQGRWGNVLVT